MKGMNRKEKGDWEQAVELLQQFESQSAHLDELLEAHSLGRLHWLVMETFRCWFLTESLLERRLQRRPRPVAYQLLRLGLTECLLREAAERPKVVHHVVGVGRDLGLSRPETGFLNGVLRGILREEPLEHADLTQTHPEWLVERWKRQFGDAGMRALLEWNQTRPQLHVQADHVPEYAEGTPWPGYHRVRPDGMAAAIADLRAGTTYAQDPFARIPVDFLDPRPGESVLDLCAAPGGKSRLLARRLGRSGRLFMVDKPGPRLERLKANVRHFGTPETTVIASRVEDLGQPGAGGGFMPRCFDAVLVDVPCSNTGVIQKRPDVKVRLNPAAIPAHGAAQARLLAGASKWVRPGGRLVYSTCSLEPEENGAVVQLFLVSHPGWKLAASCLSLPWQCGHDGGGAFLLTLV